MMKKKKDDDDDDDDDEVEGGEESADQPGLRPAAGLGALVRHKRSCLAEKGKAASGSWR